MRDLAEIMIYEGFTFTYYGQCGCISRRGLDIYMTCEGVYQIRDTETDEHVAYFSSPFDVVDYLNETAKE